MELHKVCVALAHKPSLASPFKGLHKHKELNVVAIV